MPGRSACGLKVVVVKLAPLKLRRLAWALVLVLAIMPTWSADTGAANNANACQFHHFRDWNAYSVQWSGGCEKGKASGIGILRAYAKGMPTLVFYGLLQSGEPTLGVIDYPDGFMAGEVFQGAIRPTDDRNLTIQAFRVAEKAARQAATRFKVAGNKGSALFYARKAEQLAGQMD